jgi:hypothetical protein
MAVHKLTQNVPQSDPRWGYVRERMDEFDKNYDIRTSDYAKLNTNNWFFKVKESQSRRWQSEKYKFIMDNAPLKAFYDYYTTRMNEIREYTGDDRIRRNFIPQIQRDTIDILVQDGMYSFDSFRQIFNSWKASVMLREEDPDYGMMEDGEIVDAVPLHFADNIPVQGIVSRDLGKSLLIFSYSAKSHQMAKLAEGTVLAIRSALADTYLVQTDNRGRRIEGEYKKGDTSRVFVNLDRRIKKEIYGQNNQDKDTPFEIGDKTYSTNKIIQSLISFFSKKSLALNWLSIVGGHFHAKSQMRQIAAKGIHFDNKVLNEVQGVSAELGNAKAQIALDIIEPSQEGNSGLVWEKANKISTSWLRRQYNKSLAYIGQRRSDDSIDSEVTYAMMKSYAFHPNGKDVFPIAKKHKYGFADVEVQSIWDTLVLKENPADNEKPFDLFTLDGTTEATRDQFVKFRNKVRFVAGRVKGNQSSEDSSLYNTTMIGKALMQYRGWLPATFLERWKDPSYNYTLEDIEIGRYRLAYGEIAGDGLLPALERLGDLSLQVFSFGYLGGKIDEQKSKDFYNKWKANNPQFADKVTFEEFKATRLQQWKATASEVRAYIMVTAAMLAVGFAAGDDERRRHPVIRKTIETLDRISLEIGFFFIPQEFMQIITRSPIPFLNLITESVNLTKNTLGETKDFVLGADADKKIDIASIGDSPLTVDWFEENPDRSGRFKYTLRYIPALKGVTDWLEFSEKGSDQKDTMIEWLFGSGRDLYK